MYVVLLTLNVTYFQRLNCLVFPTLHLM